MFAATARRRRIARWAPRLLAVALASACDKNPAPPTDASEPASSTPEGDPSPRAEVPAVPTLPEAEAVLSRAAEAMGGKAALDKVDSFYYSGTIELTGQNIRGDLQIWWKEGDFFMEQIVPGIGEMRAGKKGDEIWAEDPINGRRLLSGVEAEQHAWASSILLAADWQRYFDEAKTVAERKEQGRELVDIELTAASGLAVTMTFDRESGLQTAQSFEQVTPMGKQPFTVTFEDYRDVAGVKIAYKQVIDAKVQKVEQVISEVKINAEVDDSRFAFPRRGVDLVRQPKEPAPASARP